MQIQTPLPEIETALPEIETALPEIETALPEIETALPEIETDLPGIETVLSEIEIALPEIKIVSEHEFRFAAGRSIRLSVRPFLSVRPSCLSVCQSVNCYWELKFPVTLSVRRSVGWFVIISQKRQEVSLPCAYRRTCSN